MKLAYFAGLFDGEGSIIITKQNRVGKDPWHKSPNYILLLQLCMTDKSIVDQWKKFFKVGWVSERTYYKKFPNAKPSYNWGVKGNKALQVLRRLMPCLWVKRKQAEIAIEFQSRKPLRNGLTLSKEELAYRENKRLQLKKLNAKGILDEEA